MIEEGRSTESERRLSFADITAPLKENRFKITPGVDFKEVLAFINSVQSTEDGVVHGGTECRSIVQMLSLIRCMAHNALLSDHINDRQ
jgi:hypothetical protein